MVGYSSPLLDQYNQTGVITPDLQTAIDNTRRKLGTTMGPPQMSGPTPSPSGMPADQMTAKQPAKPTPTPLQAEGARLTAPPLSASTDPNQRAMAHTKADTGVSGTDQIHNRWGRTALNILEAVGTMFGPTAALEANLPGTQLHHQVLVNQNARAQRGEEAATKSAADVAREKAQTGLEGAQTEEATARSEALRNPAPKEEQEGKTVTTDQGILQWNPQTKRYDVKVGNAPEKEQKEAGTVHQLDDGTLIMAHPDGTATPITVNGQPAKGPAKEKPVGSPEQQFLDEYKARNPGSSVADAEKAFKQLTPKEQPDRGQNFIVGGKLIRVEPGGAVPEGAQTAQGVNAANTPTTTQRTAGGRAELVHEQMPEVLQRIDSMKDKLGPVAGRWNDFMQGKVGTDNPDFAALRSDLLMMSSAVALAHAQGRLPENLREEFDRAINAPKQTAENLKAVLGRVDDWMVKVAKQVGKGGETAPPAASANGWKVVGVK